MASKTETSTELPIWAEAIRQKYLAGEASLFVLHGNVYDRFWVGDKSWSLQDFLAQVLFQNKNKTVLELSMGRGLRALRTDNNESVPGLDRRLDETGIAGLLNAVEGQMLSGRSVALVIPYANTLLPNGETQFLSVDERVTLTTLHRWSLDIDIAKQDALVILIAESLAEINQALVSNPRVATVEIPIPDHKERAQAIRSSAPNMPESQVQVLAEQMAGLRALQASSIVASQSPSSFNEDERNAFILKLIKGQKDDIERAQRLAKITAGMTEQEIAKLVDPSANFQEDATPDEEMLKIVRKRKREIIEKECSGLIEFIEPKHGLEAVGGCEYIKGELMEIAKVFRDGDRTLSPMGLLAVGAMGAGKTYVIKAFVKEAGLVAVALKNFRSKWNGVTESNLDRVLATVKAMGPIAVIIDEGDRSFGSTSAEVDGGTSSRVMARLKEFMSDTENRGRVLFILMTNRPDRLEVDMKRPGRLDRKIPFFYAQTPQEQADIIRSVYKRYGITTQIDWSKAETLLVNLEGYSNADLEAVALLSLDLAQRAKQVIDDGLFTQAANDFIPPREPQMIEFMELLAVQETSRRSLLPERFQKIQTKELQERLAVLSSRFR
jgi:transitional endoplasmic reticulum ATPase